LRAWYKGSRFGRLPIDNRAEGKKGIPRQRITYRNRKTSKARSYIFPHACILRLLLGPSEGISVVILAKLFS